MVTLSLTSDTRGHIFTLVLQPGSSYSLFPLAVGTPHQQALCTAPDLNLLLVLLLMMLSLAGTHMSATADFLY